MAHSLGSGSSLEKEFQAAQDETTPPKVLEKLARIDNSVLRLFVIEHPNTPETVLLHFLHNLNPLSMRDKVIRSGRLSEDVFDNLLKTKDELTIVSALENKYMPVRNLISYAGSPNPLIRRSIAANMSTPSHIVENLMRTDDNLAVLCAAAHNPNASKKVLDMALASNYSVRAELARNLNLPEEYFIRLSKDKSETVRDTIAAHKNCPTYLLEKLAKDKKNTVARQAIANTSMSADALERLASDTKVQVKDWIPNNRNVNEATLAYLAKNGDIHTCTEVARSPQSTAYVLLQLVGQEDWVINDHVTTRLSQVDDETFAAALIRDGYSVFVGLPRDWALKAIAGNNKVKAA